MEKSVSINRRPRTSFTNMPVFEDVWNELVNEGLVGRGEDFRSYRTRLAKSVFRLAQVPWTDLQMRQLLVRGLRNDAARRQRAL
jgi:hypothetical protein